MGFRFVFDRPWLQRAAGVALVAALVAFAGPARAKPIVVVSSVELNAAASDVWAMVGQFDKLQAWHPAVESSIVSGDPTKPGTVRTLYLEGGGEIHEELTSYSDPGMRLTYKILKSPLPIDNYTSYMVVVDEGNGKSLMIWGSTFDAKGAPRAKARSIIVGIYKAGLDTLAKKFGRVRPMHQKMMKHK